MTKKQKAGTDPNRAFKSLSVKEYKMLVKKRNAIFGRYPCCDMVNNAIRDILNGDTDSAIEELLQTICKANGYLHEDVKNGVQKVHERVWKKRTAT